MAFSLRRVENEEVDGANIILDLDPVGLHVRRDGMDAVKKLEKEIGKDEIERHSDQIQKATDQTIVEIDQVLSAKEKEIMQV